MSFPRYPKYKDSGVEWLGEVPAHWGVRRLKHVSQVFPSNVDKKSYDDEDQIRLCNYTDVYYNETITADMDFMVATASSAQAEKFTLKAGDTIITKDSETADDIAISAYVPETLPGVICGYHLSIVRPTADAYGRFVKRLFDSQYLKARFAVSANGLTRVGLPQYALDNVDIPVPPLDEQKVIAEFIDRQSAKIDGLISEQEKLIALLKEKRQAVISHAVTKGLDPNVPMKDSGIEWLGQVPAHWAVKRVKDQFFIGRGRVISQEELIVDGLFPVFSSQTLNDGCLGYIDTFDFNCTQITWTTDGANAGTVFVRRGRHNCTNVCGTLLPKTDSVSVEYVANYLTYATQFYKRPDTNGAKIMNNEMAGISLLLPPIREQNSIVGVLAAESFKFDALQEISERGIALLIERRSALISAAVTGKIDVRQIKVADTLPARSRVATDVVKSPS